MLWFSLAGKLTVNNHMQVLKGTHIHLRAIEPEDLDFLFATENDTAFWKVSGTQAPFSKHLLEQYIANTHLDIYAAKQLRLIIVDTASDEAIGMIDLFDYNPQHQRAGVGILIAPAYQHKGVGSEALGLVIHYSFTTLNLHQLYANIAPDNENSLALFKKYDFKIVGIKKEWIYNENEFKDEILLQRIKS